METQKQSEFTGWAVVELFGHQREVGYVTTEVFGSAVLFRIDTPELPKREWKLEHPEWAEVRDEKGGRTQHVPAGSLVQREGMPARTKLVGPSAIYAITPCTEKAAMKAVEGLIRRELILLELPDKTPLLAGETSEVQDDGDYPGCDDYEEDEEEQAV